MKKQTVLELWVLFCTLLLPGCTSPQAVAVFATNAQKALEQGPSLFHDIHDSCIRRHQDAGPITPLFLPAYAGGAGTTGESPVCTPFAAQGNALSSASAVLSAYFKAMQELASFNTSNVGSTSENAAAQSATAAGLNTVQIDSTSKLASLVTEAFTKHFQRSRLNNYLLEADPSIAAVTQAFEDVVSKDYEGLLREERQTLTARYQNVGDTPDHAVLLLLNRAYTSDLSELDQRLAAADAYVQALKQIREGHHALAQNANHLGAKELGLALEPYSDRLDALFPVLEKHF